MLLTVPTTAYQTSLVLATFTNTVVFGFVLLFAICVMPGLASLDDDIEYLHAFQVIDGTIQNNQPIFILFWVGSVISFGAVLAFRDWTDGKIPMATVAAAVVVAQILTGAGNIPLNNRLHAVDLSTFSEAEAALLRSDFEGPWNAYNIARTVLLAGVALYLHVTLLHEQVAAKPKENMLTEANYPRYV